MPQNKFTQYFVLFAMVLAMFMVALEFSAMNLALPTMAASLQLKLSNLAWILGGYQLSWAIFMVPGGRLGDFLGKKTIFIAGLFVFALASLIGGMAHSFWLLMVSRLLQGIGAGVAVPNCMAIGFMAFPEEKRAVPIGVISAVAALGLALGPVIAGTLIHLFSWRSVFLINIPFALLVIGVVLILVKNQLQRSAHLGLDVKGFLLLSFILFSLMLLFTYGHSWGWCAWPTMLTLTLLVLALIVIIPVERRQAKPLLPLELLLHPRVGLVCLLRIFMNSCFSMVLFAGSLFLQVILALSPNTSGLLFLPYTLCFGAASLFVGYVCRQASQIKVMVIGFLLMLAAFSILLSFSMNTPQSLILLAFVLGGFGVGAVTPSTASFAMKMATPQNVSVISGLFYLFATIGNSLGSVLTTAVMSTWGGRTLTSLVPADQVQRLMAVFSGVRVSGLNHASWMVSRQAFMSGFHASMSLGLVLICLGLLTIGWYSWRNTD